MDPINRRHFLATVAAAAACPAFAGDKPAPATRGVVLYPFDLSLADWPERCAKAGINTIGLLAAPVRVKPEPGMFLEFAPIERDYTRSIGDRDAKTTSTQATNPATNGRYLDLLAHNLRVFGADTAQALEYWLDVSRFSGWKRPAVKLPWNAAICRADIAAYRAAGVRHITTFATYVDADYVKRHGDPQPALDEYGAAFKQP